MHACMHAYVLDDLDMIWFCVGDYPCLHNHDATVFWLSRVNISSVDQLTLSIPIHIPIHITPTAPACLVTMATASKSRSRVMVTPPPQTNVKGGVKLYTQEEKQQLLDNFDCEGKCSSLYTLPPMPRAIKKFPRLQIWDHWENAR